MIAADTRFAYRELEQRLRPFVARRVPANDIDDVIQDVFLRMQRALPTLRNDERFGPWIYKVARTALSENRRKQARYVAGGDMTDLDGEPCETDSSSEHSVEQDLAGYIVPFIAMLPSPYREALTLTEIDGVTQQAAAQMMGISVSGMKSRVQRGREKLRELLEQCCQIGVDARGRVIECEPRADNKVLPNCQCGPDFQNPKSTL